MEKRSVPGWDWLTGVLVFLLLQVTAARLVTTDWADHLYFAETLAALGTILGLAIGASRFRRRAAVWLTIAYTVTVVPWQISSASEQKMLQDRLVDVGRIFLVSFGQFMARQPVKAPLFFVAIVSLVFWLFSIAAGYWAARHGNILTGIIPSGIVVVVIQIYANYQLHGSWWLGVYLLIALLLIGRNYYLKNERIWSERRVYVNDEAWPNILGGLFTVAAATILIAWVFPTSISSVHSATNAWTSVTHGIRDRLSNAVTSLHGPYGKPGPNFYGSSLGLGQDAAKGDSTVFTVQVVTRPKSYLRYYWRARVYDTYNAGQWNVTPTSTLSFSPTSGDLHVADTDNRTEGLLRFTLQFPTQSLIYAPSEPVWLSQPADVDVTSVTPGLDDVLSWQAKQSLTNGRSYQVRAQIGDPNVEQLRTAIATYPQWVSRRYLQVPDNLRSKFQALAEKVTAGQTNPYDKAVAITAYLRANLQYSTTLPAPPEGRDPVEWVLFDYKKGFCNYYASAEVLMLRSVGVPARLAVGFAQGEFVSGTYVVRRRDAHAWPEVYFPGFGWTEFEPTVSQQALVRTDPNAVINNGPSGRPIRRPTEQNLPPEPLAGSTGADRTAAQPLTNSVTGRALLTVYGIFLFGWAVYLLFRFRVFRFVPPVLVRAFESSGMVVPPWIESWLLWSRLAPVEQAFSSINWSLRWLGSPPPVDATPAERAASLRKLLPSAVDDIGAVTAELEVGLFTPGPADEPRARRAGVQVVLHALRARFDKWIGLADADVYSK